MPNMCISHPPQHTTMQHQTPMHHAIHHPCTAQLARQPKPKFSLHPTYTEQDYMILLLFKKSLSLLFMLAPFSLWSDKHNTWIPTNKLFLVKIGVFYFRITLDLSKKLKILIYFVFPNLFTQCRKLRAK